MATRSSGRADPASSTATGQRGAKLRLFGIVEMYLLYESSLTLRTLERDAQGTSNQCTVHQSAGPLRYLMPVGRLYWLDRPSVDVRRVTGGPLPG
jgi:hypothetical protein